MLVGANINDHPEFKKNIYIIFNTAGIANAHMHHVPSSLVILHLLFWTYVFIFLVPGSLRLRKIGILRFLGLED